MVQSISMKMKLYPIFYLVLAMCLISCASTSQLAAGNYSILGKQYPKPADDYLQAAAQAPVAEKPFYQLQAIGRLQQDGSWGRAKQLLQQVDVSASTVTAQDKARILQAQLQMHAGRTTQALQTLTQLKQVDELSVYNQIHYHQLLAQSYAAQEDKLGSLQEILAVGRLLPYKGPDQTLNQQQIWDQVLNLSTLEMQTLTAETQSQTLQGWLALATLSQQAGNKPMQLNAAIANWQQQYPNHPASRFIAELKSTQLTPDHIAVLLPLHGKLKAPGQAIRDGLMAAYYKQGNNRVALKFYDTTKVASMAALYQQAVNEGAQFVIGPLQKPKVQQLLQVRNLSVPTLALNETNNSGRLPANLYQFGLSPRDEASLVAKRAWRDGHRAALVIAPQNAWGQGIANNFKSAWQQRGGRIIGAMSFNRQTNLKLAVKQLLHIDQSDARDKNINQILGSRKIKFTPRRRNDADMIFIVAMPTAARQIRPLLNFYYARRLPIYATSIIYAGNPSPARDKDINGVIFCDMPWVFAEGGELQQQHQQLANLWPEAYNRYTRLYAMGLDAYRLAQRLSRLQRLPSYGIKGATGILSLDPQHRIRRQLQWAKIKNGTPHTIS